MTFLSTRYRLARPLAPKELERLGGLTTVYGIRGVEFEGEDLLVEYDASRVHEAEVLAAVRRTGIAVHPHQPIAPGGFDHSGEFKDFAWPTEGISPVNKK